MEAGGAGAQEAGLPVRDLIRLDLIAGGGQQQAGPGEREAGMRNYHELKQKNRDARRMLRMRAHKESRRSRKFTEGGPMSHLSPGGAAGGRERSNVREAGAGQAVAPEGGDKEAAGKLTSLPPGRVQLPSGVKISGLACGLHHTLLLSSTGQVYSFGSNTHGQLGVGDLVPRGAPTQVIYTLHAQVRSQV